MNRKPDALGSGSQLEAVLEPCLWGLGAVYGPDTPFRIATLNQRLNPRRFTVHDVIRADDSTLVIARAPVRVDMANAFIELEIDMDRDAAIVRHSTSRDGRLVREIRVDWSHTDLGWMPDSWTMVNFRGDGELSLSTEAEVVEWDCSADLTRVEFHYDVKPGEKYLDESDQTMIKSGGGQADIPLALFESQKSDAERRWMWMSVGLVIACLGCTIFWLRRRTRLARQCQPD